jgi:hypothetical protein
VGRQPEVTADPQRLPCQRSLSVDAVRACMRHMPFADSAAPWLLSACTHRLLQEQEAWMQLLAQYNTVAGTAQGDGAAPQEQQDTAGASTPAADTGDAPAGEGSAAMHCEMGRAL